VNKSELIKMITERLAGELELYLKAARDAHAEATHEQSKAENKYDTRGLEASYLARGQSRQAKEMQEAIKAFETLAVRPFGPADAIDIGALVEIEGKKERACYFIGPRAGGTEVEYGKKTVLVVTPQSPLARQLLGKKQGDRLRIEIAGSHDDYRIVTVL
jgi:transcription elongation GreA/GreB family factor